LLIAYLPCLHFLKISFYLVKFVTLLLPDFWLNEDIQKHYKVKLT